MQQNPAERTRPSSVAPLELRRPIPADGPALWALADACGLDLNSPYAYVLWGEYFAGDSVVAVTEAGHLAGFIIGFAVPERPGTVFVWQVGVDPAHRGLGVAGRMLDGLVAQTAARCIEATVTPSNAASARLFRALAARHGTTTHEEPLFGTDLFPDGHEPEVRFQIEVAPP